MNISKAEYKELEKIKRERDAGRILTPDGLRVICESFNKDPEKIGRHFLQLLPRFFPEK